MNHHASWVNIILLTRKYFDVQLPVYYITVDFMRDAGFGFSQTDERMTNEGP